MQKLISELTRLYLPPDALPAKALARHAAGQSTSPVPLATAAGGTRAIVLPFDQQAGEEPGLSWPRLCAVANALQTELGLPAPAVSISGHGYSLWLSLEQVTPLAQVDTFLSRLRQHYLPELDQPGAPVPAALPPCQHQPSGTWAAFIHPDLGAAFADEPGLAMAPPAAGQAALLEGLHSISPQQFQHALRQLGDMAAAACAAVPSPAPAPPAETATPPGLLLKDATLDDIVRWLHARNIEPTFRHLLPK
ncbi:hypothetical protein H3H36_21645 [Duganella sp. FT3S]|uniref:Uncharacterized protein n=1 Tax=Rugamonas fusca TaxID=2758568 RepID=A0A7W2EL83_9BURK|nr:hypothetical protein [Rugamonas fusca]MBA5607966.1 hypothetical protein [Rugamonas fusca]